MSIKEFTVCRVENGYTITIAGPLKPETYVFRTWAEASDFIGGRTGNSKTAQGWIAEMRHAKGAASGCVIPDLVSQQAEQHRQFREWADKQAADAYARGIRKPYE